MSGQQDWGQQPPPPPGQQPPGWGAPPAGQQPPPPSGQQTPGWGAPPSVPVGPSKYCQSCGAVIAASAPVCPNCGARQADVVYEEPKNRPIAILLALFLGAFGIHRFYVGPIAWGVAYLVFFWTGIPAFLAWLEAIYWLSRSDVEWAQKYGGPVREANGCAIGCLWVLALLPLIGLLFLGGLFVLAIPFAVA